MDLHKPSVRISVGCLVGASLALHALAGTTLAQNALGDGRALDRNLNANAATSANPSRANLADQIRFNNRLITGEVGGGRSFRGSIGYRATDEFGAATGSSTNFNFRRDAASGDTGAAGLRAGDALQFQFALATGAGGPLTSTLFQPARSGVSSGASMNAMRSTSAFSAASARLPVVLGYLESGEGPRALTASPLRGIASTPLSSVDITGSGAAGGARAAGFGGLGGAGGLTGMERSIRGVASVGDAAGRAARERQEAERARAIGAGFIDQQVLARPPEFQAVMTSLEQNIDQRAFPPEQRVDRTAAAATARPTVGPGAGPADQRVPSLDPLRPAVPTSQPEPNRPAAEPEDTRSPVDRALDRLRGKLREEPGQSRGVGAGARSKPAGSGAAGGAEAPAGRAPLVAPDADLNKPPTKDEPPAMPEPTDNVLDALKKINVRMQTFIPTGDPNDRFAQRMTEAQTALREARFFDAEGAYSLALVLRPDDALARTGRVHAQIGAGLFLSAGGNLRTLLSDHPELIPVRYGPDLLPPTDRARDLAQRLEKELKGDAPALGDDAALLLAYLGFHFDQPEWTALGLSEMDLRLTDDDRAGPRGELVKVLERLWKR